MTIKKRLFWSDILMIFVPVGATALVGMLCVGVIWLSLTRGAGLGLKDQEDLDRAHLALTEIIENRLRHGVELSTLDTLLDNNGMSVTVWRDGRDIYHYGATKADNSTLLKAANALQNDATVSQNGRSLYTHQRSIDGKNYQIYVFASRADAKVYSHVKVILAVAIAIIVGTILLSIWVTNRFLIRFVFRKIEKPLDILTDGVHQLRDGSLDHRIAYDVHDEFLPVCADFNEMAGKLKESVVKMHQQELSRKELIAGISHDIRSPLTSIQAYVEGLIDGVAKTPAAQSRYLQTIKTKAEELEHIVAQLFFYSKMELGEYQDNAQKLCLDQVIAHTIAPLRAEYA